MTTISLDRFIDVVRSMPDEMEEKAIRALREASARGVGRVTTEIQRSKAVNTGGLLQSVRTENVPKGAILSVDAPHAPFIELGTRPHWPPDEPIREWVLRKGLAEDDEELDQVVFSIRRHIATFGTEPRHFFKKAMVGVKKDVQEAMDREFK